LRLEGKGLVRVIGDDHRNGGAFLHLLRLGVERLAEFHDIDPTLTQCRADGGRWVGFARLDLQLQLPDNFLGHLAFSFIITPRPSLGPWGRLSGTALASRDQSRGLRDLREFQFDRRWPAKDRYRDLETG